MFDVVEEGVAAVAGERGGEEHGRQLLPEFGEGFLHGFDVGHHFALFFLVSLGEDDGEGDAVGAEERDEFEVDTLGRDAAVDEHIDVGEGLAVEEIVAHHGAPFLTRGLGGAGVAVAGEVDKVPLIVDEEMINKLGLAGAARGFGESLDTGEHIDERRLADIRASDEGVLGATVVGALAVVGAADAESGTFDVHRLAGLRFSF